MYRFQYFNVFSIKMFIHDKWLVCVNINLSTDTSRAIKSRIFLVFSCHLVWPKRGLFYPVKNDGLPSFVRLPGYRIFYTHDIAIRHFLRAFSFGSAIQDTHPWSFHFICRMLGIVPVSFTSFL